MRIFYGSENGEIVESKRNNFESLENFLAFVKPEVTVLEDTKQVAIRERVFGSNLVESYYTLRGYSVWRI